jgi:hypothetical protein
MESTTFTSRLRTLTGTDITDVASALRHEIETADGEVTWWRATTAVGALLRHQHRSREAGLIAHEAAQSVLEAADRSGDVDRADAILVARAASDVARALVAGPSAGANNAAETLLAPWRTLVAA